MNAMIELTGWELAICTAAAALAGAAAMMIAERWRIAREREEMGEADYSESS